MKGLRAALIWVAVAAGVGVPFVIAAMSPQLAWRDPYYITAGFAGVLALGLMLVQPLMVGGYLPGFPALHGRRAHRWIGSALVALVVIHVAGLWITSPPDVIDALLFVSPTPFSAWGVIAMWAVFAVGLLVLFRRRLRPRTWRMLHTFLAVVIVIGTVIHAVQIQGTMGTISKAVLCALVVAASLKVVADFRIWTKRSSQR